jgi:hypothetical protein
MEGMTTLGHDMRFLSGQTEAEGERLEADGAVFLVFGRVVAGDYGEGGMCHDREGMGMGCIEGRSGAMGVGGKKGEGR